MNLDILSEIYRSLILLDADAGLLGTVGSWRHTLPDEDVLAGLRAWNTAAAREIKERIERYEMTSPRLAYSQSGDRQNSRAKRTG
jgi:hypothetical protein